MPNCSPLWFLTCIAVALLIYNLIMHISIREVRVVVIILSAMASYLLDIINAPKLPWNIDTALMALLFIGVGHLIYLNENRFNDRYILKLGLPIALMGIIAAKTNSTLVSFDNNEYGNIVFMIVAAISIDLLIIYLVKHYNPFPKIFGFYGRHTIFIMGFDYACGILVAEKASNYMELFVGKIIILTCGILLWEILLKIVKGIV